VTLTAIATCAALIPVAATAATPSSLDDTVHTAGRVAVSGDTKTGLQFLYDQPSFDSRLELATSGALPPGP
jgi:hypothetical protein